MKSSYTRRTAQQMCQKMYVSWAFRKNSGVILEVAPERDRFFNFWTVEYVLPSVGQAQKLKEEAKSQGREIYIDCYFNELIGAVEATATERTKEGYKPVQIDDEEKRLIKRRYTLSVGTLVSWVPSLSPLSEAGDKITVINRFEVEPYQHRYGMQYKWEDKDMELPEGQEIFLYDHGSCVGGGRAVGIRAFCAKAKSYRVC